MSMNAKKITLCAVGGIGILALSIGGLWWFNPFAKSTESVNTTEADNNNTKAAANVDGDKVENTIENDDDKVNNTKINKSGSATLMECDTTPKTQANLTPVQNKKTGVEEAAKTTSVNDNKQQITKNDVIATMKQNEKDQIKTVEATDNTKTMTEAEIKQKNLHDKVNAYSKKVGELRFEDILDALNAGEHIKITRKPLDRYANVTPQEKHLAVETFKCFQNVIKILVDYFVEHFAFSCSTTNEGVRIFSVNKKIYEKNLNKHTEDAFLQGLIGNKVCNEIFGTFYEKLILGFIRTIENSLYEVQTIVRMQVACPKKEIKLKDSEAVALYNILSLTNAKVTKHFKTYGLIDIEASNYVAIALTPQKIDPKITIDDEKLTALKNEICEFAREKGAIITEVQSDALYKIFCAEKKDKSVLMRFPYPAYKKTYFLHAYNSLIQGVAANDLKFYSGLYIETIEHMKYSAQDDNEIYKHIRDSSLVTEDDHYTKQITKKDEKPAEKPVNSDEGTIVAEEQLEKSNKLDAQMMKKDDKPAEKPVNSDEGTIVSEEQLEKSNTLDPQVENESNKTITADETSANEKQKTEPAAKGTVESVHEQTQQQTNSMTRRKSIGSERQEEPKKIDEQAKP